MIKVDCKGYAQEILDSVKEWGKTHELGKLYILYGGDDPASAAYMRGKLKDCEYCGIPVEQIKCETYSDMTDTQDNIAWGWIRRRESETAGIIVQLPLPKNWDEKFIPSGIPQGLDVDGFLPNSPYKPCTPSGIMHIMRKELGDDLSGKNVLLVGKGKLVGKPLIPMLLDAGCTLTVIHSRTPKKEWEKQVYYTHHDCLITAVGKAGLIDLKNVNSDLVVDAGMNRNAEGKLCGDCFNFIDDGYGKRVTLTPGGTGLTTRAMLMKNVALASGMKESDFE